MRSIQDGQSVLRAAEQAVRGATARGDWTLLPPVWDDYDIREVHAGADRFNALLFLAGLRASVQVRFEFPCGQLPEGMEIEIDCRRGTGCWLHGPGIDPQDPVDLIALALDETGAWLKDLVLGEVFGRHRFRTTRGWQGLVTSCEAHGFRYGLGRGGLRVSFIVELEAV